MGEKVQIRLGGYSDDQVTIDFPELHRTLHGKNDPGCPVGGSKARRFDDQESSVCYGARRWMDHDPEGWRS